MPYLFWSMPNFAEISCANATSQYNSVSQIVFDIRSLLPMQNFNMIRFFKSYLLRVSFAFANFFNTIQLPNCIQSRVSFWPAPNSRLFALLQLPLIHKINTECRQILGEFSIFVPPGLDFRPPDLYNPLSKSLGTRFSSARLFITIAEVSRGQNFISPHSIANAKLPGG